MPQSPRAATPPQRASLRNARGRAGGPAADGAFAGSAQARQMGERAAGRAGDVLSPGRGIGDRRVAQAGAGVGIDAGHRRPPPGEFCATPPGSVAPAGASSTLCNELPGNLADKGHFSQVHVLEHDEFRLKRLLLTSPRRGEVEAGANGSARSAAR
jgi:hypothetical protein